MEKIDYAALVEELRTDNEGCGTRCGRAVDALERLTQPGGEVAPVAWMDKEQASRMIAFPVVPEADDDGWSPLYSAATLARLIAERDAVEQERATLQEQVKVLRDALENNQWVEYNDPDYGTQRFCPDCRTDKKFGLHHPTCEIGRALAATEPKDKP